MPPYSVKLNNSNTRKTYVYPKLLYRINDYRLRHYQPSVQLALHQRVQQEYVYREMVWQHVYFPQTYQHTRLHYRPSRHVQPWGRPR